MRMNRIVIAMVTGCAADVISAVPGLAAQTPAGYQHATPDKAKPASGMAAKDHAMMAEHEKMMADIKAADQRLDEMVTKMNTASAAQTPAATAIVVTEMAAQRRTMRDGMMKMQEGMMAHMMAHMQAGSASMASCPMMKMGDKKP